MRWTEQITRLRRDARPSAEPTPKIRNPFANFPTRDYWLMMLPYDPDAPMVQLRRTPLREVA